MWRVFNLIVMCRAMAIGRMTLRPFLDVCRVNVFFLEKFLTFFSVGLDLKNRFTDIYEKHSPTSRVFHAHLTSVVVGVESAIYSQFC